MKAPLCHISAAKFWKAYGSPGFPTATSPRSPHASAPKQSPPCSPPPASAAISRNASRPYVKTDDDGSLFRKVHRLGIFSPDEPIHLLHFDRGSQHSSNRFAHHSYSIELPPGSIVRTSSGIEICRPELSFIQMGTFLPLVPLIQYGMMLCGIYATDPHPEEVVDPASPVTRFYRTHRLHPRNRIASKASIGRYLELAPPLKGTKRARSALRYILEDSRSPMEAIAALALHLPYRMGGYAIPGLQLNRTIPSPTPSPFSPLPRTPSLPKPPSRTPSMTALESAFHDG